jgi:hypothetical protein
MHSKKTACENNHATLFEEFKKCITTGMPTFVAIPQLQLLKTKMAKTETVSDAAELTVSPQATSPPAAEPVSDDVGYVYCLSNASMPGMLKVGMTRRTPDTRIAELFTTGVSVPFVIEVAKRVTNPMAKERIIHRLLSADRVNSKREFFTTSTDTIRDIFELMDGVYWPETG